MGRRLALFFAVVLGAFLLCSWPASAAPLRISISMENAVVSYTPQGYYPTASADLFSWDIQYKVTDNATGKEVAVPVKAVGSYTVTAYMEETEMHTAASATASLTVEKATVYLSVTETVVAHTAMDNPVKYSVVPLWAADLVDTHVSYRAISSYEDAGTAVDVPKDLGKYLVKISATVKDPNVQCAGKYLVYEIAERAGMPLSAEDAIKSVPADFSATVESLSAVYSNSYAPPQYHTNIAGVESSLKYSHLYANGTIGEYTDELPTTPGDYVASCFVLDTVIGSGKIIIDKLTPSIEMSDISFTYTPEGVYPPAATVTPAGIDMVYKAYEYKNGAVGDSVAFPLVDCGTYLISACPDNTALYSFVISYCYVTIEKASPVLHAESLIYSEDGEPKPLAVTVEPSYVEYDISYYRLENGSAVYLNGPPTAAGEYYAAVSVKESDTVNPLTNIYGIRIIPSVSTAEKVFSVILKVISTVFALGALAMGCVDILKKGKLKGVK